MHMVFYVSSCRRFVVSFMLCFTQLYYFCSCISICFMCLLGQKGSNITRIRNVVNLGVVLSFRIYFRIYCY